MGGEIKMTCPVQTPNDTKIAEWSWSKHDCSIKQKVTRMGPNVTFLNQSREIGTTSQDGDGTLTLRGLQLNDSGVYKCQLHAENYSELKYIKLTVNGKLLMGTTKDMK